MLGFLSPAIAALSFICRKPQSSLLQLLGCLHVLWTIALMAEAFELGSSRTSRSLLFAILSFFPSLLLLKEPIEVTLPFGVLILFAFFVGGNCPELSDKMAFLLSLSAGISMSIHAKRASLAISPQSSFAGRYRLQTIVLVWVISWFFWSRGTSPQNLVPWFHLVFLWNPTTIGPWAWDFFFPEGH